VSLQVDEIFVDSPLKPGLVWPEELARYSRTDADGKRLVRLPVRFLTIGDTMVWAAPVELFSEIAVAVRNRSPFPRTFYFGYTNGWFGYLPTSAAFDEGGYEPATSVFTKAAEADLIERVSTYIEGAGR
jgi:neutral ceramidase